MWSAAGYLRSCIIKPINAASTAVTFPLRHRSHLPHLFRSTQPPNLQTKPYLLFLFPLFFKFFSSLPTFFTSILPMPRKKDFPVRSERNGREGQKRSDGKAAGRRPRDLESGVDNRSANARLLVEQTSSRAPGLDQAAMAGDRPRGRKAPKTVKVQTKRPARRGESPDSSDYSSDTGTTSSTTDTSTSSSFCSSISLPTPYDGRADLRVFDVWVCQVTTWVKYSGLSHKEVMYMFPRFVSGKAKSCFIAYVTPSRFLPPREQSLEEIFKAIHEDCFPPGHKMTLHKELMSASQGNLRVREFASELRLRARHLPYVNEQCLAAIFFVGVHKYIRIRLIADGLGQDSTDLETLLKHALEYECARRMLRGYG